jgi:hypothetical protein
MLRDLYFLASYCIFLSFMPWPSSLERISISVYSSLFHFIVYWACWRTDLGLGCLGGKGLAMV